MMWYGDMFRQLKEIKKDMEMMNYGKANERLQLLIAEIELNGIIINAKINME
jgi:hypothetical protein